MADPTYEIQGVTSIHPLDTTTGFAITGGTAVVDHGGLALNADAVNPAVAEFRFPLPSAPVNGNNVLFIVRLYNSTNQFVNDGIIRFFDSAGSKAELTPLQSWRRGELLYRIHIPSVSGVIADPGFDVTDLANIEFVVDVDDIDETDVYVLRRLDYYDFSPVILTGGTESDPFTLDTILTTLNQEFWAYEYSGEEYWAKKYPQQAAAFLEADVPIQIGDGVPSSTVFELGTLQGFSHRNEKQDRTPFKGFTGGFDYADVLGDLPTVGQKLVLNLGDPKSYPPAAVYQTEFIDLSPAEVTYNSWLFLRTKAAFGNHSILKSCSLIDSNAAITGGKSFTDSAIVNSTAQIAVEWNGTVTFTNCRINCPDSDYGINFAGASFNDGDTFDASTITFPVAPAIKKFRLDAAGKTLNLDVGSTGVTAADVEVVEGTLNIIEVQLQLTLADIPVGAEVRIYDLDSDADGSLGTELAGVESNPGATFIYPYTGAGEDIWVQVIATGFEEYGLALVLGASSATFPVSMVPEENI